jgi:hypothetical protein
MYGALWRILPGPWFVRVVILLVLAAALLAALMIWVFPVINDLVAPQDVTVTE